MTKRYFVYDPENSEFDTFDTEAEAIKVAQSYIADYLGDGLWDDGVDRVVVGIITHRATMTNIVDEDMLDENGWCNGKCYSVSDGCESWCDYEMLPVEENPTND